MTKMMMGDEHDHAADDDVGAGDDDDDDEDGDDGDVCRGHDSRPVASSAGSARGADEGCNTTAWVPRGRWR